MSIRIASLLALLLCALPALPARADLPPVEAFGTTPVLAGVSLSPDGRFIASYYGGDKPSIVFLDRSQKKITQRVGFDPGLKLRNIYFVSDTVLLAQFSITYANRGDTESKSELGALFAINALDGASRQLLEGKTNSKLVPNSGTVLSRFGAAPGEILMSARVLDNASAGGSEYSSTNSVISVDPLSGKWRVVEKGNRLTSGWLVDKDGRVVGRTEFEGKDQKRSVRLKEGDDLRTVFENTDPDFGVLGLAADGRSVIGLGARGGERKRLWTIPFDGSGPQPLYADPEHDVENVVRDPYDRTIKGVALGGLDQRVRWLDPVTEARHKALTAALPGRVIGIEDYTRDGKLVLFKAVSRNHPGIYYLADYSTNKVEMVGQEYPQLAKVQLGKVSSMTYAARDGYKIPAYLTMPSNGNTKNLPLVVLPHGGPRANDSGVDFDWWSQFLATRGYVVLQPQYRGSTGFGQKHELAGYRQWGKLMQDDVTDGVKQLVADGTADPKRVCIVGASYGGYAALAGAAFTPDLYRCAVSIAGVADLVEMLRWVENRGGSEDPAVRFWRKHIGMASDPDVAAFSPARAADRVKAKVMLMHGVDDTVVPYMQSEFMETALKRARAPFELVQLKSEDHWLSRSPSRIEMLAQLDRFLDESIGRRGEVSVSQPTGGAP